MRLKYVILSIILLAMVAIAPLFILHRLVYEPIVTVNEAIYCNKKINEWNSTDNVLFNLKWKMESNLISIECFRNAIERMNETYTKYFYQITQDIGYLNYIKFYFLDWQNKSDPLWFNLEIDYDLIQNYVTFYGTKRLYLLSKHINRVYDINDANIIIFGFDISNEIRNNPCYTITWKTRLDFKCYPNEINIMNRNEKYYPLNPPNAYNNKLNEWLYRSIVDNLLIKHQYNLPIFMFDYGWHPKPKYFSMLLDKFHRSNDKNLINELNVDKNIIIGKFAFTDFHDSYRNDIDIQLPPPIIKSFYNIASKKDICRKRKYLYSFAGNLDRNHNVRNRFKQIIRNNNYDNERVKIINTNFKYNNYNYEELMIESTYLLIFAGDQLWSYRFREALLTYNILILIGMDHYVMPFQNVINYDEWYSNNGIIKIDIYQFITIKNIQQFERQIMPNLTAKQICNAQSYNKKMVDLYFKDEISEVNALLFSLQQRIS